MLFSATSGQFADRLEKSWFIRRVKEAEVLIMLIAAAGFLLRVPALLYLTVFLMGLHSTVFGPVKYSYLPQHLDTHEITGGNGLVEMGTFVAILLGTIGGGLLINQFGPNGAAASRRGGSSCSRCSAVPRPSSSRCRPPRIRDLRINWNPITETAANLRIAHSSPAVFNSILGISWLWFFGSIFLTSFTPFARENLGGDEGVVTFLLAVFSVGIGVGSLVTRAAVRPQGGDRSRAAGVDRHDRVRHRLLLRRRAASRRCRPGRSWSSCATPARGASCSTSPRCRSSVACTRCRSTP